LAESSSPPSDTCWSFSPLFSFVSQTGDSFAKIYELQDGGAFYGTPNELWDAVGLGGGLITKSFDEVMVGSSIVGSPASRILTELSISQ
jgi:hypothetical protein